MAEPLYRLLDKRAPWVWGDCQAVAVKNLLVSNAVLVQFDENLPVIFTCNTSLYGVGVVLGQKRDTTGILSPNPIFC